MLTLACCQDHILTENIWFVCSQTSYSGDKRRCHYAGRTPKRTTEDRATHLTQPMKAGDWVSQKRSRMCVWWGTQSYSDTGEGTDFLDEIFTWATQCFETDYQNINILIHIIQSYHFNSGIIVNLVEFCQVLSIVNLYMIVYQLQSFCFYELVKVWMIKWRERVSNVSLCVSACHPQHRSCHCCQCH